MDNASAVEEAGDALYRAFKVYEEAPVDPEFDPANGAYRPYFVRVFRTLAIYVAQADGRLSRDESIAIDRIFYLDEDDEDAFSQDIAEHPDRIETAIKQLQAMITDVTRFQRAFERPCDPAHHPLVVAVEDIFRAILASDPTNSLDNARLLSVMERVKEALPAPDPQTCSDQSDAVQDASAALTMDATDAPEPPQTVPELVSVDCPARLKEGETCYAVSAATLYQEHNVVSQVSYGGFSGRVRLAQGLSYRAGRYNVDREHTPKLEQIATGTLCITDQRLIFLSDTKNMDMPFARLLSSDTGPCRIEVTRSNSGRVLFDNVDGPTVAVFEQVTNTSAANREGEEQEQIAAAQAEYGHQHQVERTRSVALIAIMVAGALYAGYRFLL